MTQFNPDNLAAPIPMNGKGNINMQIQEKLRRILATREKIIQAFIAETGCKPSEAVILEKEVPNLDLQGGRKIEFSVRLGDDIEELRALRAYVYSQARLPDDEATALVTRFEIQPPAAPDYNLQTPD